MAAVALRADARCPLWWCWHRAGDHLDPAVLTTLGPGDVMVCSCAAIVIVDDAGLLRSPTLDEAQAMTQMPRLIGLVGRVTRRRRQIAAGN